jgi:hypothetical protein
MDLLAIFRFMNEGKRKDAWAISRAHQNFVRKLFSPADKKTKTKPAVKDQANLSGMFKSSIVKEFFINKKKHFTDLDSRQFYR